VLLPYFPLRCEVQRHPAIKGRPTVVIYEVGAQKLILDFSPELEHLQRDMPLQQALSRHGELELVYADIPRYWSIFNEILESLEKTSSLVEGSDLGHAYIGLDGLQLIYRNDDALINAVKEVVPETFPVQIGIAEGKFLAYLAARYSPPGGYRLLADDIDTFLRDLSCDVLPISARSKSKLHGFGIHTLGQVRSLPAGPLQAQFGPAGKRILELARGYDGTPLYPRSMEEVIEESTTLPSVVVSLETILVTLESLLSRAFARDGLKERGIRSLTLWTRGWGGTHWERSIQFKEPAMDTRNAIPRIKLVLENYPQPGPVEQLGIRLTRLGNGYGRQRNLFSEVRAKDHLMEDIKQLELRLGNPQVFRVKEVEPWSRIPERRYALTPLS
jgi:DNA polymerase-4/protein ImuB